MRVAEIIEKHICLDRKLAKYDFYSALEFHEMQLLANRIQSSLDILNGSFISESESEYLSKSVQIPIANKLLPKGSLISKSDIIYRRTAQTGNTNAQLLKLQKEYHILKEDIGENSSLNESQFHTANIGVIVACRMKSSRLKTKALLPINGVSSIDRCLQNCLKIKEANIVVLATSTEDEDSILQHNTLDGKVKFWQGDPNDVIQRYLGACNKYNIEVVVRVTGDCPVVSTEIASYLLEHHFATGADFTSAKNFAVGSACEIYNVEALQRVINYVGKANYSEYMTWYMQNNSDIFKVEIIDLPENLARNYRLTLDYEEDLEILNRIFEELNNRKLSFSTDNVFAILDSSPDIVAINSHLSLKYKTDQALIDMLNKETRIIFSSK
jgi:N,N'-diacetyllegionaminate synthase